MVSKISIKEKKIFVFHLKKEWFDKIKNGKKTHEYRLATQYWYKRLRPLKLEVDTYNYVGKDTFIYFVLGYPNKTDINKRLKAKVKNMWIINGLHTDLKVDKDVWDIEFELFKE